MSHTPGPWKTGREDMQSYTGDGEIPFTNIYHATETDGFHLGHSLPLTIGRAEGNNNKANARLIAAAPDLLEACKAQHKAIDLLLAMLAENDPTFFPSKSRAWQVLEQGYLAINKAEGK